MARLGKAEFGWSMIHWTSLILAATAMLQMIMAIAVDGSYADGLQFWFGCLVMGMFFWIVTGPHLLMSRAGCVVIAIWGAVMLGNSVLAIAPSNSETILVYRDGSVQPVAKSGLMFKSPFAVIRSQTLGLTWTRRNVWIQVGTAIYIGGDIEVQWEVTSDDAPERLRYRKGMSEEEMEKWIIQSVRDPIPVGTADLDPHGLASVINPVVQRRLDILLGQQSVTIKNVALGLDLTRAGPR